MSDQWVAQVNTLVICAPAPPTPCDEYPIDDTNDVMGGYGVWHSITVPNGHFDERRATRNNSNVHINSTVEVRYTAF